MHRVLNTMALVGALATCHGCDAVTEFPPPGHTWGPVRAMTLPGDWDWRNGWQRDGVIICAADREGKVTGTARRGPDGACQVTVSESLPAPHAFLHFVAGGKVGLPDDCLSTSVVLGGRSFVRTEIHPADPGVEVVWFSEELRFMILAYFGRDFPEEQREAFEDALEHIQWDPESASVWHVPPKDTSVKLDVRPGPE